MDADVNTPIAETGSLQRRKSLLSFSLRELFLITVITALLVMLWQSTLRPTLRPSGVVEDVYEATMDVFGERGRFVLSREESTTLTDCCTQFDCRWYPDDDSEDVASIWTKVMAMLQKVLKEQQCIVRTFNSTQGIASKMYFVYDWPDGNSVVVVDIAPTKTGDFNISMVFHEAKR